MKYKQYDILEIIWLDSHSSSGWKSPTEIKKWIDKSENLFKIKTVGYFIHEDKNFLRLAMCHDNQRGNEDGERDDNKDHIYAVAKSCILDIKKIR